MLSPDHVAIIKRITPLVAANAETITRRFYERMFQGNPEVKAFFNQAHQRSDGQPKALADAIGAYFTHIDNLGALTSAVNLIANKHCSLGVQPEHYPIVGKHLLAAIKDIMGEAATEDILGAVAAAYGQLVEILVGREKEIYEEQRTRVGGWNGYRRFEVTRKTPESEIISSFYLRPVDRGALPSFEAGQYITVRVDHPTTPTAPRNYSLSDRPDVGHFRLSVKREPRSTAEAPDGLISNYLHDSIHEGSTLEIGAPCGEFTLVPTPDSRPIVLLAGGVGVTPLLSMAKSLAARGSSAEIHFIQAARDSRVRAFEREVRDLSEGARNLRSHVIFDQPLATDLRDGKCDSVGIVDRQFLRNRTPYERASYYFCGPKPFMRGIYASLRELGVSPERLRFEFFGPRQEITGPA